MTAPPRVRLLDAPPRGWEILLGADAGATPAHRPEVPIALCRVLPGMSAAWITVEREGHPVGGACLCLERRGGFRWIHSLPFLLPGAPLAAAGHHGEVDLAVASALADLARDSGAVGGEWVLYRPSGEVAAAAAERLPGETRSHQVAVIPLEGGPGAFAARLDRDTRHILRRTRASGLSFAEEPDALAEVYALHLAQSRRWPGHRPLPLELSRRLLEPAAPGAGPAARLFTVRDARRLLAGMFVLDGAHETFAWWSGARAEARPVFATHRLMAAAAEWAAERGRARLNLGGSSGIPGLESFKRSLGARAVRVPVRWIAPHDAPGPARWVAALQASLRRGRFRGTAA